MPVSTKDIARIAQVSQSTVSRCLNDSPLIPELTRQKVKQIASDLGFQFNANAKSLKSNRTGTIGLIIPKFQDDHANFHFRTWQDALMESLEAAGFDVLLSFFENQKTNQNNIVKFVTSRKVDALIILLPSLDVETIEFLEKSSVPVVFCKYLPDNCAGRTIEYIHVDQLQGGYLATNHLIQLGHRNILCLTASFEGSEFAQRTKGYEKALQEHQITYDPALTFTGDGTFHSSYQVILDNQQILPRVTAIFAQNDLMALGAISALTDLNIRVPEAIAVVGFDDIELCTYYHPYLTTIKQPTQDIAAITSQRIVKLLSQTQPVAPRMTALAPELIIRESCGGKDRTESL